MTFKELLRERHVELTTPSLVEALQNPDPHIRYLAALTLAEDKSIDAVPSILDALKSEKNPEARVNIAFALAQFGEEKGFVALRSICRDRDVPVYLRIYATKYTLDLDDKTCLSAALDVLQSKDGVGVRVLALSQLSRFRHASENDSQRIVSATLKALADPAPEIRIAATDTLSSLQSARAIPALENALAKERDDTVRSHIETTLELLRDK